eukprot:574484-Rhodomonas_salina.1
MQPTTRITSGGGGMGQRVGGFEFGQQQQQQQLQQQQGLPQQVVNMNDIAPGLMQMPGTGQMSAVSDAQAWQSSVWDECQRCPLTTCLCPQELWSDMTREANLYEMMRNNRTLSRTSALNMYRGMSSAQKQGVWTRARMEPMAEVDANGQMHVNYADVSTETVKMLMDYNRDNSSA